MADAFSRREREVCCSAIATIVPDWVKEITENYEQTEWIKELQEQLAVEPIGNRGYSLSNGLIRYRGRIAVDND